VLATGGVHLANHNGRVRREVEPDAAGAHGAQQPVLAEADLLHLLWTREGREDHVGCTAEVRDRGDPCRAGRFEWRCAVAAEVVDEQLVARGQQVVRHARAHTAEPDETHLHVQMSSRQ
jgi:hypothetical protein